MALVNKGLYTIASDGGANFAFTLFEGLTTDAGSSLGGNSIQCSLVGYASGYTMRPMNTMTFNNGAVTIGKRDGWYLDAYVRDSGGTLNWGGNLSASNNYDMCCPLAVFHYIDSDTWGLSNGSFQYKKRTDETPPYDTTTWTGVGVTPPTNGNAGYFSAIAENGVTSENTGTITAQNHPGIYELLSAAQPFETDPYANLPIGGEEEIAGGGSGTVSIPGFPGLSATSTGIIGLFAPSPAQMQALASFMWTDFGGTGTTTEAILSEIVEALKRSISNPLDYVVGLNIIPSQGLSIGAAQTIQFGFVSSNVSMPALSSQYFTVDCGTIAFSPLCGDTFLDYAPYSKFSIYLPYIGVKDLDANDCVGHTIGVVYHGDTVTGGVTAYITKDGSVMYQYSGCCALNVPLSSDNWGSTIAGAVQIATSMVSGGLTAGAAGVGAAAAQGAANVAANPSLLSPQVQHSGAVSGGAGCMGVQYPYIIREAVRFHSTAGFNKISGYPSFYKRKLSSVSGYTTVVEVHLDNVPATKPELEEIIELLKGGVYL